MAKRTWVWPVLVLAVAMAIAFLTDRQAPPTTLSQRTGVVALISAPAGVDWEDAADYPSVRDALSGTDPAALLEALRDNEFRGMWVGLAPNAPWGPELPLQERFSAGGVVRGFRGEYLTPDGLLYLIDDTQWPEPLANQVLGRVARQVLEGGEPPPIDAYPRELQRLQSVEVLVLLRGPDGPRLWRSARAESIPEGLNTAALAARTRWEERSETMGGPLGDRLDQLDVEVALLFDDGTLDVQTPTLIDALVKPLHGVAYEQPTRWRYTLPAATHRGRTPSEAYRELFVDNGMEEESFNRNDLRLYRMHMRTLSVDHGSAGSSRAGVDSDSAGDSSSLSGSKASKEASGSSAGSKTTKVVPNP